MRDHRPADDSKHLDHPSTYSQRDRLLPSDNSRWTPSTLTAASLLRSQRTVGNLAVQRLIREYSTQSSVMRQADAVTEPDAAYFIGQIKAALTRQELIEPPTESMEGGAFYYLDAIPTSSMLVQVLNALGKTRRAVLFDHLEDVGAPYNRPRLESALRSVAMRSGEAGEAGLDVLKTATECSQEYVRRTAQLLPVHGAFAPAFSLLAGKQRTEIQDILRNVPMSLLGLMHQRIEDAAVIAERQVVAEVLQDLVGEGTPLTPEDVIDTEGLGGTNLTMATIYNKWGQFLEGKARALNISTSVAAAVMGLESAGKTLDPATNKPIIRFENHKFRQFWGNEEANQETFADHFAVGSPAWTGHMWRRNSTDEWQEFHAPAGNQVLEWEVVEFAVGLSDRETAYRSMSVGAAQIMGFNHAAVGYASAVDMVEAFSTSDRDNITGLFDFVEDQDLVGALQTGDYATFAKVYNGASNAAQQANYVTWLTQRENAYAQVTAGKQHTFDPNSPGGAE